MTGEDKRWYSLYGQYLCSR